jgi:hypothetical protein
MRRVLVVVSLFSACSSGTADRSDAGGAANANAASPAEPDTESQDMTQTSPPSGGASSTMTPPTAQAGGEPMGDSPSMEGAAAEDASASAIADAGTPMLDASISPGTDASVAVSDDGGGQSPPPPPPCGGPCGRGLLCNAINDECVECLIDMDCTAGNECRSSACEPIVECEGPDECPEDLAVCHSELSRCVECEVDLDCLEEQQCQGRNCVGLPGECRMGMDPCSSREIMELTQSQVVDGFGDEFCDVPGFELNFQNAASGNSDLPQRTIMRVAWSRDALHVFADVQDPEVVTNAELDSLWSGDVIELYLATSPADELEGFFSGRVDGVQIVITPPTAEQPARAARLYWLPEASNPDAYGQVRDPMTAGFAARLTDSGYAVEARVPWTSLGPRIPDIQAGVTIAFDAALSTASRASIVNESDGRQGTAVLHVGNAPGGVQTCSGEQLPWCNSTTWCSPTLAPNVPEVPPIEPEPDDADVMVDAG